MQVTEDMVVAGVIASRRDIEVDGEAQAHYLPSATVRKILETVLSPPRHLLVQTPTAYR